MPDIDSMVRWHEHSYPHPLARWHTHPEAEIHLIRTGTGLAFVGDYVGRFNAGHLVLVGAHLPHNWISDIPSDQVIEGRDVVLQVHPDRIRRLTQVAPEAAEVVGLFESASRGIEYTGTTAVNAATELEAVGSTTGVARLLHLFSLLSDHLHMQIRLAEVAEVAGMTPTAFSRFFYHAAGRGFSDMVRRLRIIRACALLTNGALGVSDICYAVGYRNLSNFNRQFRAETGTTPREYRRTARVGAIKEFQPSQAQRHQPSIEEFEPPLDA